MPHVELLGLARRYAGTGTASCPGATLGEVLLNLGQRFPAFASHCPAGKLLPPGLIVCINERTFSDDPSRAISDVDRLLILSADVGGA